MDSANLRTVAIYTSLMKPIRLYHIGRCHVIHLRKMRGASLLLLIILVIIHFDISVRKMLEPRCTRLLLLRLALLLVLKVGATAGDILIDLTRSVLDLCLFLALLQF